MTKKKEDVFFSFSQEYRRPIKEEHVSDGYKWHWDGNPFVGGDFLLSDLHSFILFGAFAFDGLLIDKSKKSFVSRWIKHLPVSFSVENSGMIFKYYRDKNSIALSRLFNEKPLRILP